MVGYSGVTSVLVADDHPLVREHVAEAISADVRLELVGEAGDGTEALLKVEKQCPDTVVLDLAMPVLDGASLLKRWRERRLPIRVLLLPGHASVVQMRNALRYRPELAAAHGRERRRDLRGAGRDRRRW